MFYSMKIQVAVEFGVHPVESCVPIVLSDDGSEIIRIFIFAYLFR